MNHSKTYTVINPNNPTVSSGTSDDKATSLAIGGKQIEPSVIKQALALVRKVSAVNLLSPQDIDALSQACSLINKEDEENETLVKLLRIFISQ